MNFWTAFFHLSMVLSLVTASTDEKKKLRGQKVVTKRRTKGDKGGDKEKRSDGKGGNKEKEDKCDGVGLSQIACQMKKAFEDTFLDEMSQVQVSDEMMESSLALLENVTDVDAMSVVSPAMKVGDVDVQTLASLGDLDISQVGGIVENVKDGF
eukprot:CAMPEP_0178961782 /NCGR_PEP_ID=MMETSP0789-20121207/13938_1 /TAXON_ID=3005 /ORGANISM="Rhizosolenia setigera, Strain CCMP 1694" /LENGTH=152 /DNA_ID=CAMNT_0020645735 /DNA_START=626 /DNA_END=1084 /DNA_ORIENTATION=+